MHLNQVEGAASLGVMTIGELAYFLICIYGITLLRPGFAFTDLLVSAEAVKTRGFLYSHAFS